MTKSRTRQPLERNKSMLQKRRVFSGFSIDDIHKAKEIHGRILRLEANRDV